MVSNSSKSHSPVRLIQLSLTRTSLPFVSLGMSSACTSASADIIQTGGQQLVLKIMSTVDIHFVSYIQVATE